MTKTWIFILLLPGLSAQQQGNADRASDRGWNVSGVVRSESGPLAGVSVSIRGPEIRIPPVQTDSVGKYRFSGTVPGTYTIRVQKPEDAGEPRPRAITLAAGERVEDIDFFSAKGSSISGRLSDRSGRPVSGMTVVAYARWDAYGRLRLAQKGGAITDNNGDYRIAHLPDGTYLLAAVPVINSPLRATERAPVVPDALPRSYPPMTFAPSGRSASSAASIEAQNGADISNINIVVEKEPVYCVFFRPSVALLGLDETPQVSAMLIEGPGARGPKAGGGPLPPNRDAQICGIPAGDYTLGLAAYSRSPLKGLGFGSTVVVVSGRHLELGALEVIGHRALKGKLTVRRGDRKAELPEGIRISLDLLNRDLLPSDSLQGKVQSDGTFELPRVYPDTYGLTVENLPRGHYVASVRQGGLDVSAVGVTPGDAMVEIEVASDGPSLGGRVLTPGKNPKPVPQAAVVLVSEQDNIVQSAQADQHGRYTFWAGVPPGNYRLVALPDAATPSFWSPQLSAQHDSHTTKVRLLPFDQKTFDLIPTQAP